VAKQTQLDKAIAQIDQEIAVLQAAKARLVAQQKAKPARASKPTLVPEKAGA
jgi:uncharacterized small protein (DUF1192 family)